MQIEDVDIWEVIVERGGGVAVYAAWCPYAEFYMLRHNWGQDIELFYGRSVQPNVLARLDEIGFPYSKDAHFRFAGRDNQQNYGKIDNGKNVSNSGLILNY
jgi:hypothetical protein